MALQYSLSKLHPLEHSTSITNETILLNIRKYNKTYQNEQKPNCTHVYST